MWIFFFYYYFVLFAKACYCFPLLVELSFSYEICTDGIWMSCWFLFGVTRNFLFGTLIFMNLLSWTADLIAIKNFQSELQKYSLGGFKCVFSIYSTFFLNTFYASSQKLDMQECSTAVAGSPTTHPQHQPLPSDVRVNSIVRIGSPTPPGAPPHQ